MNPSLKDIPYGPEERQKGDLYLPDAIPSFPPVLLIHGGGWDSLSKEAMEPVARLFQTEGRSVFNINYRLLGQAPWPACGDDCLAAEHFMLQGGLARHGLPAPAQLFICGASAGGHLAMMTGLRLPRQNVKAILSMAGPSRLDPRGDSSESAITHPGFLDRFFGISTGVSDQRVIDASPSLCLPSTPPPLVCVHSTNDHLVPPGHSEEAVAAWKSKGAQARLWYFNGPGRQHGFWDNPGEKNRRLIPELSELLSGVVQKNEFFP